jgi:hypothetical protein
MPAIAARMALGMFSFSAQQVVVARLRAESEAAAFDRDVLQAALAPRAFELLVFGDDRVLVLAVLVVGELQEDQAEHRRGVLTGLEVGVGAQLVGGGPEVVFELLELVPGHGRRW